MPKMALDILCSIINSYKQSMGAFIGLNGQFFLKSAKSVRFLTYNRIEMHKKRFRHKIQPGCMRISYKLVEAMYQKAFKADKQQQAGASRHQETASFEANEDMVDTDFEKVKDLILTSYSVNIM